jgi:hypothetical protein
MEMNRTPLSPCGSESWHSSSQLAVDQTSDSTHAGAMIPSMLTVGLVQGLVAPQSVDGVLDHNPPLGEGAVVGNQKLRS